METKQELTLVLTVTRPKLAKIADPLTRFQHRTNAVSNLLHGDFEAQFLVVC